MATTVTIPASGWNIGTCGWLAAGLADGTIRIAAGSTNDGRGGLWLHWNDKQGCLAIWNEYRLSESEFPTAQQFRPYCGAPDRSFAGDCPLTPAAEKFLRDAAESWCEEANDRRENDSPEGLPAIKVA